MMEAQGIQVAELSAMHWDLDGHASNVQMCCLRRAAVIEKTGTTPLCSARHCGNHAQNLSDNCTTDAADKELTPWMIMGAGFFRMGGNFLRIL